MGFHSGTRTKSVLVVCTTDAEGIAQNKVVSQGIEFPNLAEHDGGSVLLKSLTLVDEVNGTLECDIVVSELSTAISGDEGKSVGEDVDDLDGTISKMAGFVPVRAADYTDLIDARMATKTGIDLVLQSSPGSKSMYVHIINRGSTVTFGETNDVRLMLGVEY